MKKKFKRIGIYLRPKLDHKLRSTVKVLSDWLSNRKLQIEYLNYDCDGSLPKNYIDTESLSVKEIDLIICLGGDGTLISLFRKLYSGSPPVFGVNLGNLGFTTEFSKNYLFEDLSKCLKSEYDTKSVQLYKAMIKNKKGIKLYEKNFVNDAVFSKKDISRIISLSLEADGSHIYNLRGDGLIVSTPLGSTAYSLAANGPIIYPEVQSLVVTPICPHSLTHRPIVLPNNFSLKIEIEKNQTSPILTLDGQSFTTIQPGQYTEITKASRGKIEVIMNPEKEYFHTLKTKFTLGRK